MPDKDTFFSVVIPTYNRADLIKETLDSVLGQTYRNFEVLVIDNCSTDNTKEILQELIYSNKIRYICNEKNYERAYSRNVGMANAKGDFLTLLDSDDFMLPDCLKDANEFIKQNPGVKIFHNKYNLVNDKRELIYQMPFPSIKNQYKALCSGNFMSAIGGFIHRDIYSQFKFNLDPQMIGAEDYEFWFQIFARYKVGRIDKINNSIREHPARSVHMDVYDRLHYQCNVMVNIIKNDELLDRQFGKYTGRLKAAYKLQEVIIHKHYPFFKKMRIIAGAAKDDPTILFTKRYIAVFINTFKK